MTPNLFLSVVACVAIRCNAAFQYKYEGRSKVTSISSTYPNVQYIAKTKESFKFADLYWLQSHVMAYCNSESVVEKLAFHRTTASYLLTTSISSINANYQELPFSPDRVKYVGKVIASGASVQEFLNNIKATSTCNCYWTLDNDTFEPLTGRQFSSAMLMCAVSRHLSGEPLLVSDAGLAAQNNTATSVSYVIAETSDQLYLIEKLQPQYGTYHESVSHFRQEWARRPFQYSGAVNIEIAITVIDMLQRLLQARGDAKDERVRLVDPTVGSGTFLATAAMLWNCKNDRNQSLDIIGIDSNSKCSVGTMQNLCKLFNVECITEQEPTEECTGKSWTTSLDVFSEKPSKVTIHSADAVKLLRSTSLGGPFDCAVTNLPWNRNTFEFKQETSNNIVMQLVDAMKPGAPLIVVSGSNDPNDSFNAKYCLSGLGFDVIGEVSIPPAGFSLPKSGIKKKRSEQLAQSKKRSSDCVVTVAIAPKRF